MFSLAVKAEKLYRVPHIPKLEERNVRHGFFERAQFETVRRHLPTYVRPVVTFAYITGVAHSIRGPSAAMATG